MSATLCIYLGPYLKCKRTARDVTTEVPESRCPHCQTHLSSKYCGECGRKSVISSTLNTESVRSVSWEDWYGEVGEAVTSIESLLKEETLFVPNQYRNRPRPFRVEGAGVTELGGDVAISDKTWFRAAFADEVVTLNRLYGNSEICWGLLSWYN